jgi:hypothetical protein
LFGFGISEKDVRNKLSEVGKLTNSANAPSNLPIDAMNTMGLLAMRYDSIASKMRKTDLSSKDLKSFMADLKEIESSARKTLKK